MKRAVGGEESYWKRMAIREPEERLDPQSFVPLYFQLQELLKQKIELGLWHPGEAIPSEHTLCGLYGVSRTVVRQALAILEQDGQVVRSRGRGTFVGVPKIQHRAGGLSRLLVARRPSSSVVVLDAHEERATRRVAEGLGIETGSSVFRLAALLRAESGPVAIFDSNFPARESAFLRAAAMPREALPELDLGSAGLELAHSTVSIETSFCSQWESEQLGIPFHGAVFVTSCTEHRRAGGDTKPFELARVVYRADVVQFRLELSQDGRAVPEATWQLAQAAS